MKGLVIAVVLLIVVLLLMRNRGASSSGSSSSGSSKPGSSKNSKKSKKAAVKAKTAAAKIARENYTHRATVIVCKKDACAAARKLEGQTFLDSDNKTPLLPLPDCDVARCQCSYRHRNDRRVDDGDRRMQSSLRDSAYLSDGQEDRRSSRKGRRSED